MMKKLKSSLGNMLASLCLIASISGAALGGAHLLTKDKIAQIAEHKKQEALKAVLPAFDRVELRTIFDGTDSISVSLVYQKDSLLGLGIEAPTMSGFSGEIRIMAGILSNGDLHHIKVLKHSETPGLGSKMTEEAFLDQFKGKNPGKNEFRVKKDGGNVDAITAATISSRAFCHALNRAYMVKEKLFSEDKKE